MSFLIDPAIIHEFLDKPIELEKESKLSAGIALDGTEQAVFYTGDELELIATEADRLYQELSLGRGRNLPTKTVTLTAGGPGSGKTTLLNAWVQAKPTAERGVYADPDETILKDMRPYRDSLSALGNTPAAMALAYTKWRWASNFINGIVMNRAAAEGRDIVYGTTATAATVEILYKNARAAGYRTNTLIVAAPENVRLESSRRRYETEQNRFTLQSDIIAKGRLFYERLPVYFEQSDHFTLYLRHDADSAPKPIATGEKGAVKIIDSFGLAALQSDIDANKPGVDMRHLMTVFMTRFQKPAGPSVPRL